MRCRWYCDGNPQAVSELRETQAKPWSILAAAIVSKSSGIVSGGMMGGVRPIRPTGKIPVNLLGTPQEQLELEGSMGFSYTTPVCRLGSAGQTGDMSGRYVAAGSLNHLA